MSEYIKRDTALKIIDNYAKTVEEKNSQAAVQAVRDIVAVICPVEDVAPVIHGHIVWKLRHRGGFTQKRCIKNGVFDCDHKAVIDDRSAGEEPYCSECGKILGDYMNFCGNCGARMDGDSND